MAVKLGDKARDTVSTYSGIVTACTRHLKGQTEVLIVSKDDAALGRGVWFPLWRVDRLDSGHGGYVADGEREIE